ncbi:PepSY domain-containing protein [Actinomadura geliboluensis]|uniref:PepSY domain-containing protein n=1 Tax=Actinomadura geliboluensis TaxID=882440 RepID=A0A5S4G3P7_9ACTN|nr:PepSY domain-containing protein [Actinomadura geliboluensis]TMR27569.1 PepSY domain-containing protein [Actinomadura geliboluensis]
MKNNARRLVTKRGLLVSAVAAGVLAAGGTTAAFATAQDAPAAAAAPSDDRPGGAAAAPEVALAQAADAALKKVPGTVAEAELDDEDGKAVWELDVLAQDGTWHDVTVDSGDGKVLTDRADEDGDDAAEAAALRKASVGAPAAADAALKAVQGHVTSAEFELEDGKAVWEVDVAGKDGAEHEVTVDAASGKVLTQKTEKPDDDGGED